MSEASDFKDAAHESTLAIEEYKSCRALVAQNIDIVEKAEIYAVGAAAAAAVFSLSSSQRLIVQTSCFLPLIIAIIGSVRYFGIDETMHIINNYIEKIEKKIQMKSDGRPITGKIVLVG